VAGVDPKALTERTERQPIRFQLHGTTIALGVGAGGSDPVRSAGWVAAMIRGPSGSGKSDLALRCLAQPLNNIVATTVGQLDCRLVADDCTDLVLAGGLATSDPIITAQSPASIAGLIEVRGLGIVRVPHVSAARLVLIVDLVTSAEVPRYPVPTTPQIEPVASVAHLPHISIAPFEAASPLKLLLALVRTAATSCPFGADAAKHHCLPEGQ
jgi:HPr kinase/phosphorylase